MNQKLVGERQQILLSAVPGPSNTLTVLPVGQHDAITNTPANQNETVTTNRVCSDSQAPVAVEKLHVATGVNQASIPVSIPADLAMGENHVLLVQSDGDQAEVEVVDSDMQQVHIIVEVDGQQLLLSNAGEENGQPLIHAFEIEQTEEIPADATGKNIKVKDPTQTSQMSTSDGAIQSDVSARAPLLFQVRAEDGSFHEVNMDVDGGSSAKSNTSEAAEKTTDISEASSMLVDRPFQCDLCSATFTKLGNYTRHRMVHTIHIKDDYRYKCDECGRMFLQRCDLKRHLLTHSGNMPFKCTICGKGYVRKSDLVVHTRFHNNERAFHCSQCTKSFYQSGDLQRHIRQVHERLKPLTCGHCRKKYSKEATLIRHMQTTHRDIILASLSTKSGQSEEEDGKEDAQKSLESVTVEATNS